MMTYHFFFWLYVDLIRYWMSGNRYKLLQGPRGEEIIKHIDYTGNFCVSIEDMIIDKLNKEENNV